MRRTFVLLGAIMAVLLAGCIDTGGYQPPKYPLAWAVPTMVKGERLKKLPHLAVRPGEFQRMLQELGVWDEVMALKMPASELNVLSNGLAKYGYAELDAHRCEGCSFDRIAFIAEGVNRVAVKIYDSNGGVVDRVLDVDGRLVVTDSAGVRTVHPQM